MTREDNYMLYAGILAMLSIFGLVTGILAISSPSTNWLGWEYGITIISLVVCFFSIRHLAEIWWEILR